MDDEDPSPVNCQPRVIHTAQPGHARPGKLSTLMAQENLQSGNALTR